MNEACVMGTTVDQCGMRACSASAARLAASSASSACPLRKVWPPVFKKRCAGSSCWRHLLCARLLVVGELLDHLRMKRV